MVRLTIARLAALAAAFITVSAAPMPGSHHTDDSAVGNEVAVSASDGVVMSDSAELSSQLSYTSTKHDASTTTVVVQTTAHVTATAAPYAPHTTPPPAHDSTTVVHAPAPTHTSISHGSGYKNWGGSDYDNCVQQCIAKYGAPDATYTPPPATHTPTPTHTGGASTHTIIVAPTQGFLRMVPFAVNAAVGDTVKFIWGANMHTVTRSSKLQRCNATAEGAFTSGVRNASFVFEQTVNDTAPIYYYCSVGKHCSNGMFGVINPPTAPVSSNTTVASWMATAAQKDPDVAAMWSYANQKTSGTSAETWATDIDLSQMPEDAYGAVVENVLYGQMFYSANPGMLERGQGASAPEGGEGIKIPEDITAALASQPTLPTTQPAAAAPIASPTSESNNAGADPNRAAPNGQSNDARSTAVSTAVVGFVALAASFLIL